MSADTFGTRYFRNTKSHQKGATLKEKIILWVHNT